MSKTSLVQTVIVVIGNKKDTRKICNEFKKKPIEIQGKPIKVVDGDKYLGFRISSKGVEASIRDTFEERRKKAWSKLFTVKRLLYHPVVQKNGYVRSGIVLFRAAIVPVLLYSSDCWYGLSKNMVNKIEAAYRKLLYCLLDIPTHTKYETVLLELGLMKAKDIIDCQKICFINKVWYNERDIENKKMLLNDYQKSEYGKSVMDEIIIGCQRFGVSNIFRRRIFNEDIKFIVKRKTDNEYWNESMKSKYSVTRMQTVSKFRYYHEFVKGEGRAVLVWRCGSLKFRSQWRKYYMKKYEGITCPHPCCGEEDSLVHALKCPFMITKLGNEKSEDKRMGVFLMKLNRERIKYYRAPIL